MTILSSSGCCGAYGALATSDPEVLAVITFPTCMPCQGFRQSLFTKLLLQMVMQSEEAAVIAGALMQHRDGYQLGLVVKQTQEIKGQQKRNTFNFATVFIECFH